MPRILVISDTHLKDWEGIPPAIAREVSEADWVVHCGDFTGIALLQELQRRSHNLAAVYGNTDGTAIRQVLPDRLTLDIAGLKVGVIHPAWGGPPWGLEKEILSVFPGVDIILYGHTHEPEKRWRNNTLLLNPGQGYATVGYPATYGLLVLEDGQVSEAEIHEA